MRATFLFRETHNIPLTGSVTPRRDARHKHSGCHRRSCHRSSICMGTFSANLVRIPFPSSSSLLPGGAHLIRMPVLLSPPHISFNFPTGISRHMMDILPAAYWPCPSYVCYTRKLSYRTSTRPHMSDTRTSTSTLEARAPTFGRSPTQ